MIEIHKDLYVGDQNDERASRGQSDLFVVHACKEPYHRQALGYTTQGAPKSHPEYLLAHRPDRLILNLVDVDKVAFISPIIVDTALSVIHDQLLQRKVLVHCNQGMSRSPTICMLYLAKHTDIFNGLSAQDAMTAFRNTYPAFNPARGMADYLVSNWGRYARTEKS